MGKYSFIKVIIGIFAIIIFLVIIELSSKMITNKVVEYNKQKAEEEKMEEMYNSEEGKIERKVSNYVKEICIALKSKDYNYLWTNLNTTYKNYKFNDDISKFNKYVNENSDIGTTYEITSVKKSGMFYVVGVGISNGNKYTTKYFSVEVQGENAFAFLFDEYLAIKEMQEITMYTDIKYEIVYNYYIPGMRAYVIKIENVSETDLNIEFLNSMVVATGGRQLKGSVPQKATLKPLETQVIEIGFGEGILSPLYIELNMNKNDENVTHRINFSEKID